MQSFDSIIKNSFPLVVFLNSVVCSFSEPFLAPIDPFIRHEIRYMVDEGGLTGFQQLAARHKRLFLR